MNERRISRSTPKTTSPVPTGAASISSLSTLLQQTSLGTTSSEVTMLRGSTPLLTRFRSLHPSEFLVLFTPVVPPPPGEHSGANIDPFEPLGQALSRHHKRIRHVPYVPNAGMTDTHLAFLQHAGAVVIVVCDMPNATSVKGSEYEYQRWFARSVIAQAMRYEELVNVPIVLLLVSGNVAHRGTDFDEFKIMFKTRSYTSSALLQVANAMVG